MGGTVLGLMIVHGLYQQAITDALVQDWQGYTEVFASLIPKWRNQHFSFKGLYTHNNVSIDGTWDNGKFYLKLKPNGAAKITIKISLPQEEKLMITGSENLTNAVSNELLELEFDGNTKIEISN